jgi:exonuclease III
MGKIKNTSSDDFCCPHCLRHYIYKASFDKHVDKCASSLSNNSSTSIKHTSIANKVSKPKLFACPKCSKSFSGLKWLAKHTTRCIGPCSTYCNVDDPSDFANVYAGELDSLFIDLPLETAVIPNYSNYLSELAAFHPKTNKLKFLHLNINSLFLKCFELNQILELDNFDLIFLNETKLDENIPNSFFAPTNYNLLRLDRKKNRGGGVMVLVKNSLKLVSSDYLPDFEAIHLKINLNLVDMDFICCYNPNYNNRTAFINSLEHFLLSLNLDKLIFIVGDLNINLNSDNGVILNQFANKYDFRNYVQEPTRVVNQSSSLIDVILHNSNFLHDTSVIGCPFSDHKFVACSLVVKPSSSSFVSREFVGRSYSQKNLASLKVEVDNRMHQLNKIKNVFDPNNKLKLLSSILKEAIDLCCPIKTFKFKPKDDFPWISHDLLVLKNRRDFLYSIWRDLKFDSDWLEYTAARRAWRTANRKAMIEYFKDKGISDFKKFWQFYRASIRLKSDIPLSTCPSAIRDGDTILTSPDDISNSFYSFFTSIKSTSTLDVQEAKKRILKNFQDLKLKLKFNKVFKFRKVTESVEIIDSNHHRHFNSCIELRIVPHDWK